MTALEVAGIVLTVAHILGLAAVLGPFLLQARMAAGFDLRTVLVGSIVQLVAGFGLVGLSQASEGVDSARVVVRVLLTLLIVSHSVEWLNGYKFGFEILLLNGALVYLGLLAISRPGAPVNLTAEPAV